MVKFAQDGQGYWTFEDLDFVTDFKVLQKERDGLDISMKYLRSLKNGKFSEASFALLDRFLFVGEIQRDLMRYMSYEEYKEIEVYCHD